MEINVTGKHIDLTEAMETYVYKKCERIERFYDRIKDMDVLVDRPGREFEVDLIVRVEYHDPFIAKSSGEDFYGCMDNVVDKLTRQITEYKDRIRNRKHPS